MGEGIARVLLGVERRLRRCRRGLLAIENCIVTAGDISGYERGLEETFKGRAEGEGQMAMADR